MLAGDPTAGLYLFQFPVRQPYRHRRDLCPRTSTAIPRRRRRPEYFYQLHVERLWRPAGCDEAFRISRRFSNPANSTFTERAESPLDVAAFDPTSPAGRADIPEPSPGEMLDSQSDRLMYRVAYRNFGTHESLVFNQTVRLTPLEQPYRAGVRVYELRRPVGGTFRVPEADDDRAILRLRDGWAARRRTTREISRSNTACRARRKHRPIGICRQAGYRTRPAPFARRQRSLLGTGVQTAFGFRWGNYTGMTVDPVDDCTFWMTNQYYTAESQAESPFSWLTRIGKFKFDECTRPPDGLYQRHGQQFGDRPSLAGAQVTASAYSPGHATPREATALCLSCRAHIR